MSDNDAYEYDGDKFWVYKLPSGGTLLIAPVPRSDWVENPEAHHLGDDFGYFALEYSNDMPRTTPQIIAKFVDADRACEFAMMLAKLLPEGWT